MRTSVENLHSDIWAERLDLSLAQLTFKSKKIKNVGLPSMSTGPLKSANMVSWSPVV